jgi:hypothetical protein
MKKKRYSNMINDESYEDCSWDAEEEKVEGSMYLSDTEYDGHQGFDSSRSSSNESFTASFRMEDDANGSAASLVGDPEKLKSSRRRSSKREERRAYRDRNPSPPMVVIRTRRCDRGRRNRTESPGPLTQDGAQQISLNARSRRHASNSTYKLRLRTTKPVRRRSAGALENSVKDLPTTGEYSDHRRAIKPICRRSGGAQNNSAKDSTTGGNNDHSFRTVTRRKASRSRSSSPGSLSLLYNHGRSSLGVLDFSSEKYGAHSEAKGSVDEKHQKEEVSMDDAEILKEELSDLERMIQTAKRVSVSS